MNLAISIAIYSILFLTAPLIAFFYGEPVLISLVRVLGLRFIITVFCNAEILQKIPRITRRFMLDATLVQVAGLKKKVKFKKLMIVELPSTFLGGAAGIRAAFLQI